MVATLQLEVAGGQWRKSRRRRLRLLTLLVQLDYGAARMVQDPAGCFFPAPDVDSACGGLIRRANRFCPKTSTPPFVKIVKRTFRSGGK